MGGTNLAPYRRLQHGDLDVLVAKELLPLAPTVRISTRRWVSKGFRVEFLGAAECHL